MSAGTLVLLALANLLILYFTTYGFLNLLFLVLFLVEFARCKEEDAPYQAQPKPPKVSLVVPAYNEEKVIVQTVRALMALDYPDFEIVVIDDGSQDRTAQVLIEAFGLSAWAVQEAGLIPTQQVLWVYHGNPCCPLWLVVLDSLRSRITCFLNFWLPS